ncbi:unnamed protein product [Larinioides sclopetarius]|uniref:Uncharacterized protein n=1 Tax=Larinioides sclopetarius TaxID=280406 RepID=A0AAV2BL77_9ARAC
MQAVCEDWKLPLIHNCSPQDDGNFLKVVIGNENLCDIPAYRVCETPGITAFPKTEEDINRICPIILEKLDCEKNYAEKCVYADDFPEAIFSERKRVAEDVCQKDSPLHLSVVQNIGCFNEVFEKDSEFCSRYIRSKARVMTNYIRNNEAERGFDKDTHDEELWMSFRCLMYSFDMTCSVSKISERCGPDAKSIEIEVLTRANIAHRPCSAASEEKIAELSALFDLELEEEASLKRIFPQE